MKLRTKIICISSIGILLALLIASGIIYTVCSDITKEEALNAAYAQSREIKNKFGLFESRLHGSLDKIEAQYFFKTNREESTVCVYRSEEYYNNTALSLSDITFGKYQNYAELMYREGKAAGRNIYIFKSEPSSETVLYHIVDITAVYEKLRVLALAMLCISAGVTAAAIGVLFAVVGRTLAPLSELSRGAKQIAAGAYDKRVAVKTRDEVGTLAADFNTMAAAVEAHAKELEETQRRKSLFMGSLTHELKTPLTAISGYAQTLRAAALGEEDREEALTYIYEEAGRLDRLAKKMMRILELDRNIDLVFEEIPLKRLFTCAVKTCAASAARKSITLRIGSSEGSIRGDFDLMCDVMVNLIDNAIKASPWGGAVLVGMEGACIMVEDYGCGIPSEEIGKLAEPFYMVDKSRSRKSGGAGLGLALAKRILDSHGMELRIESEVGKGTKILIYKSFATR